jgi:hypothetical protein
MTEKSHLVLKNIVNHLILKNDKTIIAYLENYLCINFRCKIENQVSDYRLLGASSLLY